MNTEKNRMSDRSKRNRDFKEKSVRKSSQNSNEELSFSKMLRNCIVSVVIGIIVSIVLLIIFAIVSYSNVDPDKLIFPLSLAALYIGAVVCGIITAKKNGEKIFFCGLVSGFIYLVMIFMVSLIPEESGFISKMTDPQSIIAHLAVIIAVIFGSVIGTKRTAKKPSMKHKIPRG